MSHAVATTRAYDDSAASVAVIRSTAEIDRLLREAHEKGLVLVGALNQQADRETGTIVALGAQSLTLQVENLRERPGRRHRFSVELGGQLISFTARVLKTNADGMMDFTLPDEIYVAERREGERVAMRRVDGTFPRVAVLLAGECLAEGEIVDQGAGGLGIVVPGGVGEGDRGWLQVRFVDGEGAGREVFAEVRNVARTDRPMGWTRIGLRVSSVAGGASISVERFDSTGARQVARDVKSRVQMVAALTRRSIRTLTGRMARNELRAPAVPICDFRDAFGERIRAIIDHVGNPVGAPAVIIPPAWGKTKESLLPLSETILETFRRAGESVVVVRYDGIRRRGESFNEPACLAPGREFLRFTVSQALRDVRSVIDFVHAAPRFRCRTSILVTFSASAIEGRRAVAMEREGRISGWISVVGAPDLQYAMRVLSGGVDYYGGLKRGFRFGQQEILGTTMDVDLAGLDALENGLASLEDARRDMARIHVPVTWIHGRFDGWMSLDRVRDVVGCGETAGRRLIEIPTGHQLKTSREALDTFRLIASEVARMALGRRIQGALPDLGRMEARRLAERERLPRSVPNVRSIWKDYLVGRDGQLGIELMTASDVYGGLMKKQLEGLQLEPDCRVADLGSGTGALTTFLAGRRASGPRVTVHQVDLVREGLARARERLQAARAERGEIETGAVVADLNVQNGRLSVPLRSGCYDRVLAGLLISYLDRPAEFMKEVHRILRVGGRVVVSSLRRDADISQIYIDGIAEMSPAKVEDLFGAEAADELEARFRLFLNEGARILDLEERGYFRFWDESELARLVEDAGFAGVETARAFGDPPQAVVASGVKR